MVYVVQVEYLKTTPVDMDFFSEKLTWLNILKSGYPNDSCGVGPVAGN